MAFRLRRGTDAERLIITPEEGELIYTTDSKKIFVGDGNTLGGNAVDTTSLINLESELGNLSIDSFGDVNSDSTVPSDGDVLAYDAATGDWRASTVTAGGGGATSIVALTDVDGTGLLNDDVLVFNSVSGNFERATFRLEALLDVTFSNLNNSVLVYDNVAGTFNQTDSLNNNIVDSDSNVILDVTSSLLTGDVQGNILAEDSSIVVNIGADAGSSTVTASLVGDVTGDLTGDVFAPNGVSILDNGTDGTDAFFTGDVAGDVTGDLVGTVTGTVNGTLNGTVNGILNGDVIGSVFNDASSLVIDGQFGDVYPRKIISDGLLRIQNPAAASSNFIQMESNDQYTSLALLRVSESDLTGNNERYGQIRFGKDDSTGRTDSNIISANEDFLYLFNAPDGVLTEAKVLGLVDGNVGIGTLSPTAKLDVEGAIKPGVYADNAARDAAITAPVAGMMVFNTTGAKFQGYDGTSWVDLN